MNQKRECFSDEVDSGNQLYNKGKSGASDGATIEVPRRRRGRPPGSKNKPKPPVLITREAEPSAAAMRPHILEIPAGHDVVDSLAGFSRRRNLGICVLAGAGPVANVALRQPPSPAAAVDVNSSSAGATATVVFRGRFEILSMCATFLPPAMAALSPAPPVSISVSLAGPPGQIIGGTVTGPLIAAGTVVVVAAAFTNPTYHRLPAEDDVSVTVTVSCGGGGEPEVQEHHQHRRLHAPVPVSQAAPSETAEFYSCHLSSDPIWASPATRPPPY